MFDSFRRFQREVCLAACWHLLLLFSILVASPALANVEEMKASVPRVVLIGTDPDGNVNIKTGSGFAVAPDLIVTNVHVLLQPENWTDVTLTVVGPRGAHGSSAGEVIAYDRDADLALIRVAGADFRPLPLATSRATSDIAAFALGYPGTVDNVYQRDGRAMLTPSVPEAFQGAVSNYNSRSPTGNVQTVITHSALIAPGNSGGPLVDECGRVIGVNTWVDSGTGRFSFAVASHEAIKFLRANGISPSVEDVDCVSAAQRAAREVAAAQKASEEQAKISAAKEAGALAKIEQAQRALEAQRLENERQTQRMLWLSGISILAAGALAYFVSRRRHAPPVPAKDHALTSLEMHTPEPEGETKPTQRTALTDAHQSSSYRAGRWVRGNLVKVVLAFGVVVSVAVALTRSEEAPVPNSPPAIKNTGLSRFAQQQTANETAPNETSQSGTQPIANGASNGPDATAQSSDESAKSASPSPLTDTVKGRGLADSGDNQRYACTFIPQVSKGLDGRAPTDSNVSFLFNAKTACVNGRTQYAREKDGVFGRLRADEKQPNQVFITMFQPSTGMYAQARVELGSTPYEAVLSALQQRQRQTCDANAEVAENTINSSLDGIAEPEPLELLIWKCVAQ
jgi:S1-C subfamily serine protease